MQDDLVFLYRQLREQLEAAYAAPCWDNARIELITNDMHMLEGQLTRHAAGGRLPSACLGPLHPQPEAAARPAV